MLILRNIMKIKKFILISVFALFFVTPPVFAQNKDLLSPEEVFWLESRNNTIVAYPEKNNPPFSYKSAGGNIQGLSVDYLELIAEKINTKITYLSPQSRSQILEEFTKGKGDVIVGLMETEERGADFIFTDSYVTVPTVIIARKDFEQRTSLTLNDFNGKRVSVIDGSVLEEYIHKNYPRVIIEDVSDNEVSLQQIILGEVDAGVMDIASLSFYVSKQVLNSVKIVGNTGLDYKPALALLKDKAILQSILEKGMTQISSSDRTLLIDKWITTFDEETEGSSIFYFFKNNSNQLYFLILILFLAFIAYLFFKRKDFTMHYLRKDEAIGDLKKEVEELEGANDILIENMKVIKEQEDKIQEKIKSLE